MLVLMWNCDWVVHYYEGQIWSLDTNQSKYNIPNDRSYCNCLTHIRSEPKSRNSYILSDCLRAGNDSDESNDSNEANDCQWLPTKAEDSPLDHYLCSFKAKDQKIDWELNWRWDASDANKPLNPLLLNGCEASESRLRAHRQPIACPVSHRFHPFVHWSAYWWQTNDRRVGLSEP